MLTSDWSVLLIILSGFISYSVSGCQSPSTPSEELAVDVTPEQKSVILAQIEQSKNQLSLCDRQQDQSLSDKASAVYHLEDNIYLVEVLCFLGAYQGNYQYVLVNKEKTELKKISFSIFRHHNQQLKLTNTSTLVGTPTFDPMTQVLLVQSKARSLGDCGSLSKYKWQDYTFELQEYRLKSQCDGVYLQPNDYPLIYP